jgi:hypothetical protein
MLLFLLSAAAVPLLASGGDCDCCDMDCGCPERCDRAMGSSDDTSLAYVSLALLATSVVILGCWFYRHMTKPVPTVAGFYDNTRGEDEDGFYGARVGEIGGRLDRRASDLGYVNPEFVDAE